MADETNLDIHGSPFNELIVTCKKSTCNSASTLQDLLSKLQLNEKYEVWQWLREELRSSSSKVTLQIQSSCDSSKAEFNIVEVTKCVEASPQNHGTGSSLVVLMDKRMLAAVKDTSRNTEDEHPSDSYIRKFAEHMLDEDVGLLTEAFCTDHGWEYPLKLHVDALLMDSFIREMNHEFGGLTEDQQGSLQSVLDEFNNNALTHSSNDYFLLEANPEFIIV